MSDVQLHDIKRAHGQRASWFAAGSRLQTFLRLKNSRGSLGIGQAGRELIWRVEFSICASNLETLTSLVHGVAPQMCREGVRLTLGAEAGGSLPPPALGKGNWTV
jgi:hypothetical protein